MSRLACLWTLLALGCSSSADHSSPAASSVTAAPVTSSRRSPANDPSAAKALLARGAIALDVRTPDEVAAGKLPGATNIPVDELGSRLAEVDALAKGDKAAPIVVYCRSGRRSARAFEQLTAAGYTNVVNGGGFDDLR